MERAKANESSWPKKSKSTILGTDSVVWPTLVELIAQREFKNFVPFCFRRAFMSE